MGYVRASTERQQLGPEAQRAELAQWATSRGVTLVEVLEDAVSGGAELEDRPALLEALAAVARHRAGLLVVTRRDRLARDVVVASTIERAAMRAGARVVTADGVASGDGPGEIFQRAILDSVAQYERALIRERTRAALRAKRARGERAGAVPWGYAATPEGRLEPLEHEQRVTERVRALRAQGMPLRGIVATLRSEGAKARTGQPLQLTQVARIAAHAAR
ncbi:MAG: recombinase family protein [Deltaproteobacteria bacterium]|nr:recombinase family protein [Deltaproteobacteria bacterium]